MGRNSSSRSESPVRNHKYSRGSPSRRERSPARHRSSRSTKSPNREKSLNRPNSPKNTRSRSPSDRVPVKEIPSSRTRSPLRATDSRSPSPRSKRLRRDRSKDDKSSERGHEKNQGKVRSHESRAESPRTRRLKRTQTDKSDKLSDRGHERNARNERDLERDRKSGRDADDNGRDHHRSRHRSHSPPRDEGNNPNEGDHRNDNDDDSVTRMKAAAEALETKEKQKPSFELSGKLAAETNRVKGVTLLFTEPPDARKPEVRWRLYVFKGGEALNEPLYVHRQTCYLFGRERRVADIPTDHPSCSKQHAVLQYRQVEKEQPDGMLAKQIRPYIMDLGSTNGTFINESTHNNVDDDMESVCFTRYVGYSNLLQLQDNRIEPQRYYELMEKDTLKFGNSSREYVLLHENSA